MSILDIIVADKYRLVETIKSNAKSLDELAGPELAKELDYIADNMYFNKTFKGDRNPKNIVNRYINLNDHSLSRLLRSTDFTVIGEIKRGSPSKGLFASDLSIEDKVKEYKEAEVKCISVLTDHNYFYGSYSDLAYVRSIYAGEILNKDFVVDEIQLDIASKLGATVVLLIVAALSDKRLMELYNYAKSLGLSTIVEVHNELELRRALSIAPEIIGINNRDLKTFHTDIEVSLKLASKIKEYKEKTPLLISESGIKCGDELNTLKSIGFKGALIGESLIRGTQEGVI